MPWANQPALPSRPHIFLIVLENRSPTVLDQASYLAHLGSTYARAINYRAVAHPSLPNYLALTSGSTWAITDDGYHALPGGGIGSAMTAAGVRWRAYMEGLSGDCLVSRGSYAVKHNPFAYYGGACPSNVVSFASLPGDLASGAYTFTWITPDLCHDMHDCSAAVGDSWLEATVPAIMASAGWRRDGVLFIVFDEDDGSSSENLVPLVVISPRLKGVAITTRYDHYSLLATIEDRLGLSRVGASAGASPIVDIPKPQG
jgi:hypothetical protein